MKSSKNVADPGDSPGRRPASARGPAAVAASILGVTLLGVYFAASRGDLSALPGGFLITAGVLALAFWFPAMRIASPRDVVNGGVSLFLWLLAWTLVWDLATSGIVGTRSLFDEWWLVYPVGILGLGLLLVLHGTAVRRRGHGSEQEERSQDRDGNTDA